MRRKEKTKGDEFMMYAASVFKKELQKRKMKPFQFFRQNADIITAPTLHRILNGENGGQYDKIAQLADRLGYELKLIPKIDKQEKYED